ncbi:GYD domain-containing protein [Acidianus brierleyi]|uniref:GYD domain superfamily n=1 Tax=Acidianus brierleyi TaxID=41673 RepID=A0A2U9II95_9CREN|nr:GYD domain-containing protein [Acidianus brierleyi]AWR95740.1 GYD domain-containing protein [Acidianus brierleyi]
MSLFIVLSRLTDEGAKTVWEKPERILEVNKELENYGAKVLYQYAMFGEYDFVNVVEVNDPEKFLKGLINLNSRGTVRTNTFLAMSVEDFIKTMKSK